MNSLALFFTVLSTMLIAEMGDKTQFLLVAMASKYKIKDIVIGTAAANIVLNLLAVGLGSAIGNVIPVGAIKILASAAFLWFALTSLSDSESEESLIESKKKRSDIVAVFGAFFIAELGDKTQIAAVTMGASKGTDLKSGIAVFFGCTLGLFAADMIGLAVGYLLKSKIPKKALSILSFFIFAAFGIYMSYEAAEFFTKGKEYALKVNSSATAAVAILFIAVCAFILARRKKEKKNNNNQKQDKI